MRQVAVFVLGAASVTGAQPSRAPEMPPLAVGMRVDTTLAAHREVLGLWRSYLADRPHTYEPKPQWSEAEQRRWPIFDLTMPWVYLSDADYVRTRATVVDIGPPTPGDTTAYVVRTLFSVPDSLNGRDVPIALSRVYATREAGRWVLANALPRMTAHWRRRVVGRITYVYPPEHRFDQQKARRSAAFVDSVSAAFGVPRRPAITFYVARNPEELARALGLDFAPPGSAYGRSYPANNMVFSGLPAYGEWYPHELTHLALARLLTELGTPGQLDEALAVWLGGSRGKTYRALVGDLDAALRARPGATLDSLLASPNPTDMLRGAALAVLLQLVHERGGIAAVRTFITPARPPVEGGLPSAAARAIAASRSELDSAWRALVARYRR